MKKVILGMLLVGTMAMASDTKVIKPSQAQKDANFRELKAKWKKQREFEKRNKTQEKIEMYVEDMTDDNDIDLGL